MKNLGLCQKACTGQSVYWHALNREILPLTLNGLKILSGRWERGRDTPGDFRLWKQEVVLSKWTLSCTKRKLQSYDDQLSSWVSTITFTSTIQLYKIMLAIFKHTISQYELLFCNFVQSKSARHFRCLSSVDNNEKKNKTNLSDNCKKRSFHVKNNAPFLTLI